MLSVLMSLLLDGGTSHHKLHHFIETQQVSGIFRANFQNSPQIVGEEDTNVEYQVSHPK